MTALDTAPPTPPSSPGPPTRTRTGPVDDSPLPRGGRMADRTTWSEIVFALALLLAWALAYLVLLSGFQAGHTQASLYPQLRSQLAEGLAPTGSPIAAGAPVAVLDVPGLGLSDSVVVEGASSTLLRGGPGHVRGSVLPGQVGTSVLEGRSLSFGAPFRGLTDLPAGSTLTVTTQQGTFDFRTLGLRRSGEPIPTLASGGARLVLATSAGDSPLARTETVYLDADLVGTPAPAGALAPTVAEDAPMSRDAGPLTWALLALSLQLLLLALGWVVWARLRWSVIAAWTTGVPVLLAALWIASSAASRLLPNLV